MLEKTVVTPRYTGHIKVILPEGKTLDEVRDRIDYVISEQLLKRIIAESSGNCPG